MRGRGIYADSLCKLLGITPAYAGKRRDYLSQNLCRKDHPRVCGEEVELYLDDMEHRGSPPRMRGRGANCPMTINYQRITPAYAGKSG